MVTDSATIETPTSDSDVEARAVAPDRPEAPDTAAPEETEDFQVTDAVDPSAAVEPAAAVDGTATERARRGSKSESVPVARPAKFLADLTRAMRAAAQAERDELLAGHQAEASAYLEQLRAESAERATSLRRTADEDVVGIREWSKAELARIREETDRRIAERRAALDRQLEDEGTAATASESLVEDRVQAYRDAMDRFFERLLTIEDPATFAALAANLPEPPAFDAPGDAVAAEPAPEAAEPAVTEVVEAVAEVVEPEAAEPEEPVTEGISADVAEVAEVAAAEPQASAEAVDAGSPDPRVAALSMMSDFAAAESEAGAGLDPLAFLGVAAPAAGTDAAPAAEPDSSDIVSTRIVVTGLASVAGIASFKRQLARRPGIQSVTVTSAPDGEFVFTVVHRGGVDLQSAVVGLEGFDPTITATTDGEIAVTARDPEAAA